MLLYVRGVEIIDLRYSFLYPTYGCFIQDSLYRDVSLGMGGTYWSDRGLVQAIHRYVSMYHVSVCSVHLGMYHINSWLVHQYSLVRRIMVLLINKQLVYLFYAVIRPFDNFQFFIQKIGSSSQRNASRCGLWWAEMLKARGQFKDAANIYFRISNEVLYTKKDDFWLFEFLNLQLINYFPSGTFFACSCNAWTGIILLFAIEPSNVTQVWFSSCSGW